MERPPRHAAASRKCRATARSTNKAQLHAANPRSPKQSRDPSLISGRLVAHRDGYGFVVPDKPIPRVDGDLFIGRDNLADAMHGDRVLARVERRRADGRAEGRIVEVVERAASDARRAFPLRPARKSRAAVRHAHSARSADSARRRIDARSASKTRRACRRRQRRQAAACACRSSMAPS